MEKPTDEQIKEFWKWCGFKLVERPRCECHPDARIKYWLYPDKETTDNYLPPIDLNSLFKYAVPKLRYCSLQFHGMTYVADVCIDFANHHISSSLDPTLALFWAIWEIKE